MQKNKDIIQFNTFTLGIRKSINLKYIYIRHIRYSYDKSLIRYEKQYKKQFKYW